MTNQTNDLLNTIAKVLLRCWLFGFVLLFVWLSAIFFMGEWIYERHAIWFGLTKHELELIFYCGIGLLKICILTFFFIPWLAIKLVLRTAAET